MSPEPHPAYDLVGVGFGPANLALGIVLEEEAEAGGREVSRLFLEARREPCWHPGLLLEDSLVQITVLKDLATVRNPQSRFTFLCYLHEQGRLFEFLNLRDLFPSRVEFNDYLGWVARQLAADARFGCRVEAVRPLPAPDGGVAALEVEGRDAAGGERFVCRARNLVVATGGRPWTPPGVDLVPGGRAFHAAEFLFRLEADYPDRQAPYRFLVVGAGQSGAELFHYLVTRYPNADVTATMRRFGYKPVDESDFTNEVFFPEKVDFIFDLDDEVRRRVIDGFRDVNYAVVDAPLIRKIYRFLYDEKVAGRDRARVRPLRRLVRVNEEGERVVAVLEDALDPGRPERWSGDGVVVATGFEWSTRHPLLDRLAPWFEKADDGSGYRVERDYGIAARDGFRPRVYLQGYCEATHGISETVLSLLPMRAQDVYRSLVDRLAAADAAAGDEAVAALAAEAG